jgi:cell wall-associated NlpC family hydrolase
VPQQQDQLLYWEQESEKRKAAQQAANRASVVQPEADRQIDPANNYNSAVQTVRDIGASANAGVLGSLQTRANQESARRQQYFQQQAQAAISALQQQASMYRDNLSSQYLASNTQYATQPQQQLTGSQYNGQAYQIAQYARQAGFPEDQIPTAVAIAMAESSGNAGATHGNTNGSTDYGLMQINSIHSNLLSQYNWNDPAQNMQMAYQIWKDAGGNWSPWVTYNTGAYQNYLDTGNSAASYVQPVQMQPFQVPTVHGLRTAIVADAKQYLGVPYVWGGEDLSKGVDCSGLVQSVYKQFGINLPRTADEQSHMGVATSISNLTMGDLVAWRGGWRGPSLVGHIAIYLGNGQILEAPYSGATVRIRAIRPDENVFGVHLTQLG